MHQEAILPVIQGFGESVQYLARNTVSFSPWQRKKNIYQWWTVPSKLEILNETKSFFSANHSRSMTIVGANYFKATSFILIIRILIIDNKNFESLKFL